MGEWLCCLPAFLDDKPAKPSGTAFHGKKPSVPPPVSKKPTKPADPKLMAQTDDQKVQESQKSKTDTCVAAATQTALFCLSALINVCSGYQNLLTLNVRGPSYLGLTRSISWLLMPWLLTSSGHQQQWYWLCRIGRFLSYLRKDLNYLCRINVEKWHKM